MKFHWPEDIQDMQCLLHMLGKNNTLQKLLKATSALLYILDSALHSCGTTMRSLTFYNTGRQTTVRRLHMAHNVYLSGPQTLSHSSLFHMVQCILA